MGLMWDVFVFSGEHRVLKHRLLMDSRGPGGFRALQEARWNRLRGAESWPKNILGEYVFHLRYRAR